MPTRPDSSSSAAGEAAAAEAAKWVRVADAVPAEWSDVAPTELAVVRFYDPGPDLERRAARWGHRFVTDRLDALCFFAAGLAQAEAQAWDRGDLHLATQAYEDRRFLAGDRILHWAVPWLDAVGRCYPDHRATAHPARDGLLEIGDHLRAAPDLGLDLGLGELGEDAYGPLDAGAQEASYLRSIWSGALLLDATLVSMTGGVPGTSADDVDPGDIVALYENSAARWLRMAAEHPGSAMLWRALASRAFSTASRLAA